MHVHFEDKDPLTHVYEKRMEGIQEIHGTELPGHLAAGCDSLRETALFLLILASFFDNIYYLIIALLGWLVWKMGRSAWLGWSRLERLHRLIEQEKYEIEHHRPQEREELNALYRSKGFEGKLLDDVVDVLMADQDRLLKVMLEEEMGLTLEAYEHPLKQSFGAGVGVILGALVIISSLYFFSDLGLIISSLLMLGIGALISAWYENNKMISAFVWNVSFGALSFGLIAFLKKML